MSEIKYPVRYDGGCIIDAEDNIIRHTLCDVRAAFTTQQEKDFTLQMVEACNNYYKLKEQNEKLKEQIRQTEAWLSFNTHPDKDQIRVFRNSMIELLKSCES